MHRLADLAFWYLCFGFPVWAGKSSAVGCARCLCAGIHERIDLLRISLIPIVLAGLPGSVLGALPW